MGDEKLAEGDRRAAAAAADARLRRNLAEVGERALLAEWRMEDAIRQFSALLAEREQSAAEYPGLMPALTGDELQDLVGRLFSRHDLENDSPLPEDWSDRVLAARVLTGLYEYEENAATGEMHRRFPVLDGLNQAAVLLAGSGRKGASSPRGHDLVTREWRRRVQEIANGELRRTRPRIPDC